MKLSIVATLYRSASYIKEFCNRADAVARQFCGDGAYEIVLVHDGSPDDSLARASQMAAENEHIVIIDLSRNFGHHKAMMTGLRYARGAHVFLIDSDLEEEPEWLIPFYSDMCAHNSDVVYGVQQQRKGDAFERISGALFYKIFRAVTGLAIPDNIVVARLMTRRYVDALIQHGENELFMAGLWFITGFQQDAYRIVKHATSPTTYTLRKKISQLVNAITSFSNAPLVAIFTIGCGIFALAALYTIYLVANWLFADRPPGGYTSLMASVWLLGGMMIAFLGIIGIYLSKIYTETKNRPYTIIRNIIGGKPQKEAGK